MRTSDEKVLIWNPDKLKCLNFHEDIVFRLPLPTGGELNIQLPPNSLVLQTLSNTLAILIRVISKKLHDLPGLLAYAPVSNLHVIHLNDGHHFLV